MQLVIENEPSPLSICTDRLYTEDLECGSPHDNSLGGWRPLLPCEDKPCGRAFRQVTLLCSWAYVPGFTGNNEADNESKMDIDVPNVSFKGPNLTGNPLQKW
jgi:hypothetical protein